MNLQYDIDFSYEEGRILFVDLSHVITAARIFVIALFGYVEYGLVLSPLDAGFHHRISRPALVT